LSAQHSSMSETAKVLSTTALDALIETLQEYKTTLDRKLENVDKANPTEILAWVTEYRCIWRGIEIYADKLKQQYEHCSAIMFLMSGAVCECENCSKETTEDKNSKTEEQTEKTETPKKS
jgi:hypothetical protein